jgi:hypothetical protein
MKNSIETTGFSCIRESIKIFLILLFIFGCSENSDNISDLKGLFNEDTPDEAEPLTRRKLGAGGRPRSRQTKETALANEQMGIGDMLGGLGATHNVQKENDALEAFKSDNEDRKLIKRADIKIKVEDLEAADSSITDLMEKYNAYSASAVIDKSSYRYRIRVPSFAYKAFLTGMDGMGTVLNRSESVEDETIRYYDIEGRLDTKKELLKTFQSYLGKAKNIEEILSVEKRIAELQSDIDGTGKELRNLSNSVDYATIGLVILGPEIISPSLPGPTLTERIKKLFSNFGDFLSGLVVIFIGIVIFGIPILLLVIFFYWILFGKIGIMKKLWRMAAGRKRLMP